MVAPIGRRVKTRRGVSRDVAPIDVDALDPGVRDFVAVLRAEGVDTFESCEGGPGHAYGEPTVRFHGNAFEGYRVFAIAMNHGLPVAELRRVHQVLDGQLEGPWWELTFRTTGA